MVGEPRHRFFGSWNEEKKDWDEGRCPGVLTNDYFLPGADAETLRQEDVGQIYALVKEFGDDGALAWAAKKRGVSGPWRGVASLEFKAALARLAKKEEMKKEEEENQ